MVVITKATFGDEFSSTDVMKTLNDKFKDGAIDLYVDSSIIPFVDKATGVQTVTLTDQDKADITQLVAEMCGPNDQVCMQVKTQEQVAARLKEKEAAKTSSTTEIIKGRRLTVEYIDKSGAKRVVIVPEGQQFQLGDIGKLRPTSSGPIESNPSVVSQVMSAIGGVFGTAFLTFLYASSIIITWMTFIKYNSRLLAGGMVALAVFIPYSGFGLSFFGPFIAEYFRVEKLAQLRAATPGLLPKTAEGIIPKAPDVLETMSKALPTAAEALEDPTQLAADMRGGRFLLRRK